MTRLQAKITYAVVILGTVALFAVFIAFRHNAALISALSAAGAVAAAGFAALAATGSMRAAAESSNTARRSREALARTVRPRVYPVVSQREETLLGLVRTEGHAAIDVMVVWIGTQGNSVTGRTARLEPLRPDQPPSPANELAVELTVDGVNAVDAAVVGAAAADPHDRLTMVWLEYWDDNRMGHWRDTWQWGTGHQSDTLIQTDSELVD